MTSSPNRKPKSSLILQHGTDCACWDCVDAVERAIVQRAMDVRLDIGQQVDLVVSLISEFSAAELLPVLRTLQWLRDNELKIKQRTADV